MKSTTVLLVLAGHAYAFPAYAVPQLSKRQLDANPWQPVPAGGVRGPCPGHNTLANHGFINRDGKNITVDAIEQGFFAAFNMAPSVSSPGAANAIALCSSLTGTNCTAYNLDQLSTPHQIEHDGSLSRDDFEMPWSNTADNHDFNQTIWNKTKAIWGPVTHLDQVAFATSMKRRAEQAAQDDAPGWFQSNFGGGSTEAAFIAYAMNDPTNTDLGNPQARLDWVDYWISNERLPTDLGWVKQTSTADGNYIGLLAFAIDGQSTLPPTSTAVSTVNVAATTTAAASSTPTSTSSVTPSSSSSSSTPTSTTSVASSTSTSAPVTSSSTGSPSVSSSSSSPAATSSSSSASTPISSSTPVASSSTPTPTPSSSTPTPTPSSSTPPPTPTSSIAITTILTTVSLPPVAPSISAARSASSAAQSTAASLTSAAAASATAGTYKQKPHMPNPYKDHLTPKQWKQLSTDVKAYVAEVKTLFAQVLKEEEQQVQGAGRLFRWWPGKARFGFGH